MGTLVGEFLDVLLLVGGDALGIGDKIVYTLHAQLLRVPAFRWGTLECVQVIVSLC